MHKLLVVCCAGLIVSMWLILGCALLSFVLIFPVFEFKLGFAVFGHMSLYEMHSFYTDNL